MWSSSAFFSVLTTIGLPTFPALLFIIVVSFIHLSVFISTTFISHPT